jgi:hypothetical protein
MSLLSARAPSGLCELPDFGNVGSDDEPDSFSRIACKMRIHR